MRCERNLVVVGGDVANATICGVVTALKANPISTGMLIAEP
jgi:hypothetical protein